MDKNTARNDQHAQLVAQRTDIPDDKKTLGCDFNVKSSQVAHHNSSFLIVQNSCF
jgi:hypothetical protein